MKRIHKLAASAAAAAALFAFSGVAAAASFQPLPAPGCATSIGVGNSDKAWITGCTSAGAGNGIFRWSHSAWSQVSGAATKIAVAPDGTPWVVNSEGSIFKWNGSSFQPLPAPGCAREIGVGSSNKAWVIGCDSRGAAGYGIYRWTGSAWTPVSGAATKIAVAPNGTPWVVNGEGSIFKWNGSSFQPLPAPGCAREIGVGDSNTAWVIGCNSMGAAGYGIYRWSGSAWTPVSGAATRIAVAPSGTPWVINADGAIFKWR